MIRHTEFIRECDSNFIAYIEDNKLHIKNKENGDIEIIFLTDKCLWEIYKILNEKFRRGDKYERS